MPCYYLKSKYVRFISDSDYVLVYFLSVVVLCVVFVNCTYNYIHFQLYYYNHRISFCTEKAI